MLNLKSQMQKSTYSMEHLYKALEQIKLIYGDRNVNSGWFQEYRI